ncbi:hypothetical protein CYMTET_3442, partial [Cymbomonas tetramitiformis]
MLSRHEVRQHTRQAWLTSDEADVTQEPRNSILAWLDTESSKERFGSAQSRAQSRAQHAPVVGQAIAPADRRPNSSAPSDAPSDKTQTSTNSSARNEEDGEVDDTWPFIYICYASAMLYCNEKFANALGVWGRFIATNPWKVIFVSTLISCLCGTSFSLLDLEKDGEKLWVPQQTQIWSNKEWVEEYYGEPDAFAKVYVTVPGGGRGSVLRVNYIRELFKIDAALRNISIDSESYDTGICSNRSGGCYDAGVLRFWCSYEDFTTEVVNSPDSHMALIQAVNRKTYCSGQEAVKLQIFGVPTTDNRGNVLAAEVLSIEYRISGSHSASAAWRTEFLNVLDESSKVDTLDVYYLEEDSIDDEVKQSVTDDFSLLLMSCMLTLTLLFSMHIRGDGVQSCVSLALAGMMSIGLSFVMGYGICIFAQILFTPLCLLLPFILLGIGMDDILVLTETLNVSSLPRPLDLLLQVRDLRTLFLLEQ